MRICVRHTSFFQLNGHSPSKYCKVHKVWQWLDYKNTWYVACHKYYCLGLWHWEKITFYTHLVLVIQSLLYFSYNLVFWKDVYWLKFCLHASLWDSYWKEKERLKIENLSLDNILVSLLALKIKWEQVVWKMLTRYKSPLCTWYLEVSVYAEPDCLTIPLIMKLSSLLYFSLSSFICCLPLDEKGFVI